MKKKITPTDLWQRFFVVASSDTLVQIVRYTFVGGLAFLIDFGLLFVLTEYVQMYYLVSASISFIAGLITNYLLSKIWVFDQASIPNRGVEFIIFALIGLVGLGLNNLFLWLLTEFLSIHYIISKIITTVIVYFWNFFARKIILFTKKT
ncbi:MAG: GtrA family protein [Tannerella sp.]|jgi:putative flippase GtrA|nr:GtrA family protein [Tannerella sp.]